MKRHLVQASCYDKRGRLIATAENNYRKTHPLQAHFAELSGTPERKYLHAEILALLRCKGRVVHAMHVERYYKDGKPALAAPCPMCRAAIKAFGVVETTYTE
jgi:tRNA(Arg) A34 adenosine deaminase TadA